MKTKLTNKKKESLIGLSFVGIWIFGFLALTLIPLFQTIAYSFNEVKIDVGGINQTYVFLQNFKRLFTTDLDFLDRLREYVIQIFLYIPIILVFSFIVAIILNQKIRFRGLFRTIYFLPVIIISGPVINELFSQGASQLPMVEQYGIIASIQEMFPAWLAEPITTMFTEMIFILWMSGVQIIIFLSGLQKIDRSIYEAASIDGASSWETFWKITLPSVGPLIAVNVLYSVVMISTFANNPVLRKIRTDMFSATAGYGYASAEAIIYCLTIVIILAIIFLIYLLFRRRSREV